jgi:hypothetical protein
MISTSSLSAVFAVLLVVSVAPNLMVDDSISVSAISDSKVFAGQFTVTHFDPSGEIISQEVIDNLVTNEGMECTGDLLFNGSAECAVANRTWSYLSVGLGGTAPVDANTDLETESATCLRVGDATVAVNTGSTGQRTYTISSTFSGANCESEAYLEVGVFDTSVLANGNMLARATFASITLSSGDSLQIDYDIVINNT